MATTAVSPAITYARENQQRFLDELKALLRIPSVSTAEEHKGDVLKAAEVVAADLKKIGFEHVETISTSGHPLVYADWLHAAGKPTALCYAHYDVQPAEPLDEWLTPPFEPTERNQNVYARGAVDDKGQLWMQLKAFESLFKAGGGKLPINVRVLIEGEEEVGGESIEAFVKANATAEKLKSDFALVTDTELFAPDIPTLCVGLRGLLYTEIEVRGSKVDLHSGVYGGAAPNAIFGLVEILSKLKDAEGKVLIPGFYDDVQKPTDAELKAWASLPFDEEEYRKNEVGSNVLTGEPGYSVLYRTWARPTLEVHGIVGGFIAPGAKTVIPAKGSAKVSMRLVPNQDADDILKKFTDYVAKITPKGISTSIKVHSKGPACVVSTDNPYARASVAAMHEIFGKDTVYIRSGGSIPIVTQFEKDLKIPSIMMGMGLPDDNLHAPNEKFHIPNFYRGIESIIRFFQILGQGK
jgi:acetylornithine deacetylase/succinyl-diaminopimelate desuccinylase-like protein